MPCFCLFCHFIKITQKTYPEAAPPLSLPPPRPQSFLGVSYFSAWTVLRQNLIPVILGNTAGALMLMAGLMTVAHAPTRPLVAPPSKSEEARLIPGAP